MVEALDPDPSSASSASKKKLGFRGRRNIIVKKKVTLDSSLDENIIYE